MTFEFLTGVAYLDGRAAGRQGEAEFPPHPDRVFMALVAAWAGGDDGERMALEWLESAGSPAIVAGETRDRPTITVYSPGNDDLAHYDGGGRNVDRRVSSTVPDSPRVTYLWDGNPPASIRENLDRVLARVTYLGRSESVVCAWLGDALETPTWSPVERGGHLLRVPCPGRLDELVAAYNAGIRPTAAAWQAYGKRFNDSNDLDVTEWSTIWPFEIEGPADLRHTVRLARAVRTCLLAACPDPIPEWVSGHASNGDRLRGTHVGVVPLANVGHAFGDGRILGVGLTIPRTADVADRMRCLGNLFSQPQRVADAVIVRRVVSDAAALNPDSWCQPSRSWGTVTPISCHKWPKGDVAAVIEADLRHAGLPAPEAVEVRSTSPHKGGLFGSPMNAPRNYRTHAVIHWATPVQGPVAIGAGRYLGMGFCKGLAE